MRTFTFQLTSAKANRVITVAVEATTPTDAYAQIRHQYPGSIIKGWWCNDGQTAKVTVAREIRKATRDKRCKAKVIEAKVEAEYRLFRVLGLEILREAYPGAKVCPIGHNTFRVNYYETASTTNCFVATNRIQDSFLARVVPSETGPKAIRLQSQPSKKLVKYSDRWKK